MTPWAGTIVVKVAAAMLARDYAALRLSRAAD
jgi:hypothetical protein